MYMLHLDVMDRGVEGNYCITMAWHRVISYLGEMLVATK